MAGLLKNKFVKQSTGVDFSRSLFPYEKRHSTNLLAGMIVPVHTDFLLPGTSPDWNFGCVIESAPLIATNFDNIYVDVVCIWTPARLVMTDWNEFLGESHTQAFTINRNITIPKLQKVIVEGVPDPLGGSGHNVSRAYLADNYLAPHIGYRLHENFDVSASGSAATKPNADSIFAKGISVLPSRVYELNWNTFFRNQNIQAPILIDKTSVVGTHDATYQTGLGHLLMANKLKTWYTVATPAPSLLDVSLGLNDVLAPVGVLPSQNGTSSAQGFAAIASGTSFTIDEFKQLNFRDSGVGGMNSSLIFADVSALTVNKMYYALMEQRFANKLMKGRRAVEFYKNFFGVNDSAAADDLPTLLVQKRFPLNVSQVIATASATNGTDTTDLGQKGAFSVTGFGDTLVKDFTATEHGFIQTYLIIRGQPSLADGIDHYLGIDSLLDSYIPTFDHIGPVGIEQLEVAGLMQGMALNFGFTNAWYWERNQVSDCCGIIEPGQPLAYKTLANSYGRNRTAGSNDIVISNDFIKFDPRIMDRIFLYPVCFDTPASSTADEKGQQYLSNRYQFICQFVVKGKVAKVMSADSEPLTLRL